MSFVRDGILLTGSGLILYGLWQWSAALAFVTGGAMLVAAAVIWTITATRKQP